MYTKPVLHASAPILAARNRLSILANDLPKYRDHVAVAAAGLASREQRGCSAGQIRTARQHLEHARTRVARTEAAIAAIQESLRDLEAHHAEVWRQERERLEAAAEAAKSVAIVQREGREAKRRRWNDIHAREASLIRRFAK